MGDLDTTEPEVLTAEERSFCELFVLGRAPFAGNAGMCYAHSFKYEKDDAGYLARILLTRDEIKNYIDSLFRLKQNDTRDVKNFLVENLKHIIAEASTQTFTNAAGDPVSPAALRSVAVAASRALMDLYPVKQNSNTAPRFNITGTQAGAVTFNVIVPDKLPTNTDEDNQDENRG